MSLLDRAKVVMLVSHNPAFLRRLCTRGLYIDHGQMRAMGDIETVVSAYEQQISEEPGAIVDNRASSSARLECVAAGCELKVTAQHVPLLGESWVGVFDPHGNRHHYLNYRNVSAGEPTVVFRVDSGRTYEVRLYRWTPGGESLEASTQVDLTNPHPSPSA